MSEQEKPDDSKRETTALALPPMSRGMLFFTVTAFFLFGVAVAAFVLANPLGLSLLPGGAHESESPAADLRGEPEQFYQCPMHPEVIEREPLDCPICGMELMPMDPTGSDASGIIEIDPVQVQNTGVVSVAAQLGTIDRTVRTVGILYFNAARIT